jgi:hypothetical protein
MGVRTKAVAVAVTVASLGLGGASPVGDSLHPWPLRG